MQKCDFHKPDNIVKRWLMAMFLLGLPFLVNAQQKILLGFEVSPGVSIISVKDRDTAPSSVRTSADGYTYKVKDESMVNVRLYADFLKYDPWVISTGLWFANKKMFIRNTDGGYSGASHYDPWYVQIPFILKRDVITFDKDFSLQAYGGLSADFKMSENVRGGDYAHYWNLAHHRKDLDPKRGRNGNGQPVDLFNPVDLTMHLGVGVQYKIFEDILLFGGLSGSKGFINMINPNLRFDDANHTRVKETLKITSGTFTVDVGVKYLLRL